MNPYTPESLAQGRPLPQDGWVYGERSTGAESLEEAARELQRARGPAGFVDENQVAETLLVQNARLAGVEAQLAGPELLLFSKRQEVLSTFWHRAAALADEPASSSARPKRVAALVEAREWLQDAQRAVVTGPTPSQRAIGTAWDAGVLKSPDEPWAVLSEVADEADALRAEAIARGSTVDFEEVSTIDFRGLHTDPSSGYPGYSDYFRDRKGKDLLTQELLKLGPGEVYLDVGSGTGVAAGEVLALRGFKGSVVAVDPYTAPIDDLAREFKGRFKFYKRKMETVRLSQPAKLMTDFHANLAYSTAFDRALAQDLSRLAVGGKLYGYMGPTHILGKDGKLVSAVEWMANQEGIQVTELKSGGFEVTKTQQAVKLPRLELSGLSDAQVPPTRIFHEV